MPWCYAIIINVKKVMQNTKGISRTTVDEFARIVNASVQKTQDVLSEKIVEARTELKKDISEVKDDVSELKKDVSSLDNRLGRIERQFNGQIDDYSHTKKRVTRVESHLGLKPLVLARRGQA